MRFLPVSYTHLDVYKRQLQDARRRWLKPDQLQDGTEAFVDWPRNLHRSGAKARSERIPGTGSETDKTRRVRTPAPDRLEVLPWCTSSPDFMRWGKWQVEYLSLIHI